MTTATKKAAPARKKPTARKKKAKVVHGFEVVEPGSPELEAMLSLGYMDMTREKAEAIIAERKADPHSWPYAQLERAEAYLAALDTKPIPVSNREGWKRQATYGGG